MRNAFGPAKILASLFCWLIFVNISVAGDIPRAKPEEVGLSSERLAKITANIKDRIAQSEFPGAVLLIARHGKIGYFESFGLLDPELKSPMSKEAIYRIYSMSKPITTVAAMALFEDGKIGLDEPVSNYLPQFKDLKVVADSKNFSDTDSDKQEVVPLNRPITVQDLMRHTAGFSYGYPFNTGINRLYAHENTWDDNLTNAEFVERLAKLPLSHQPGTTWEYSHSLDVLGRLIEVVSGKSLFEFEKERILDPLGMNDTGFFVADKQKQALIAEPFKADARFGNGGGTIEFFNPRIPRKWESGGGGMISTAMDYAKFLQMLLNGGTLDGKRILGPKTIAFMTADHLGGEVVPGPFPGYGWGLGFAVRREAGVSALQGSLGDYWWLGAGGTNFWVDPKEDMLVVFMTYKPSKRLYYRGLLREMVYASIIK
jgi:CubicO group peptidase (beta-lactamase class C family)